MDKEYKIVRLAVITNGLICVCAASIVLGLYYMSGSFHALWGLLALAALSSAKKSGGE